MPAARAASSPMRLSSMTTHLQSPAEPLLRCLHSAITAGHYQSSTHGALCPRPHRDLEVRVTAEAAHDSAGGAVPQAVPQWQPATLARLWQSINDRIFGAACLAGLTPSSSAAMR